MEQDVVFQIMGRKFLDGFTENCLDWDNEWTDEQKNEFKANEVKKFLAILFLQNVNHSTYNELLVEYRKSFRNLRNIYPKSLEDVVDVMRQVTPKKKKPTNNNRNCSAKSDNKNGQDQGQELELSNAQNTKGQGGKDEDKAACYCCRDKSCRLW